MSEIRLINEPEIECLSRNPPWGVTWHVRRVLKWINKDDLKGISAIILADEVPAEFLADGNNSWVRGFYVFETEKHPARIILSIKQLYIGVPSLLWWSTVPTLLIGRTLAHEIGHHVLFNLDDEKIKREPSEDIEISADLYAENTIKKLLLHWSYKLGQKLVEELASWYFVSGIAAAQNERYCEASKQFDAAWHLNPDIDCVADYYWFAKEKCS